MSTVIQPPNGTRDLYPIEAARRRFITEAWRRVSICHGFEEIDGPTFEHLDLYTVKSGEGIVSELFSFRRAGGEKDFALRPEFTPTMARMYAARAKSLPSPTKWFSCGPYFRAERPQRGRLREFLQWNCDVIGGESDQMLREADADVVAACVGLLAALGLNPTTARVKINNRQSMAVRLRAGGVPDARLPEAFGLLDQREKLDAREWMARAQAFGFSADLLAYFDPGRREVIRLDSDGGAVSPGEGLEPEYVELQRSPGSLWHALEERGLASWCEFDNRIVRGLAYYTGMVFEVIVDGERAVAGGGRYDNLIELFGGPPTPAVGFGMGDVVLSLVLQDKGLMPADEELVEFAGLRPDVFVISNGTPEANAMLGPVVALLRRGAGPFPAGSPRPPSEEPRPWAQVHPTPPGSAALHVRRSYKATKKIGKLLQEAAEVRARLAVILESPTEATIKDMRTGTQDQSRTPIDRLGDEVRRRLA
ncbi:MAG: ATP phosphoribosyltransferase regulatory subunit [Phycisphaeraceae bacterium]|nr:ATP phosphoribosyltransferase regulatory subunit [Phycisphaerae bacterium]MBX3393231.1 ATP phosphoribosyltransferase regulatory subunit [Phycisphaeraceae bacterium]